ncbi:response regulator [Agromyces kandeliae]|uniref:Response regulator n=1 Tax=Agromyces kandeliae TaxID=2666141 RepID=A0A6L5R3P9_9MICO|nr:response regulator transcription factor [Agromyces kandeliae]MRX44582.1 response regulator [Agromyces kandeliae]
MTGSTPSRHPSPRTDDSRGDAIRVLVVDDQALVRTGFRMILEIEPDLEVVGEVADGEQAVEATRDLQPHVVLMDVRMPRVDGIEATRRIVAEHGSAVRVVMLTTFDLDEYVYDALQAGASGFLLKDVQAELLVAGVRAVHEGDALLAPSVTRRMIETFVARPRPDAASAPAHLVAALTDRERDVLALVAQGRTNGEIAADLFISETTVKTHVGRLLAKLGARDRVHAVIIAYEAGLTGGVPRRG